MAPAGVAPVPPGYPAPFLDPRETVRETVAVLAGSAVTGSRPGPVEAERAVTGAAATDEAYEACLLPARRAPTIGLEAVVPMGRGSVLGVQEAIVPSASP